MNQLPYGSSPGLTRAAFSSKGVPPVVSERAPYVPSLTVELQQNPFGRRGFLAAPFETDASGLITFEAERYSE